MNRKKELLEGLVNNTLTTSDLHELLAYIRQGDQGMQALIYEWMDNPAHTGLLTPEREQHIFDRVMQQAKEVEVPVGNVRKMRIWRNAAAAAMLALTVGATFVYLKQKQQTHQLADMAHRKPAANKAILTLAGGKQVELDSAGHQILQQGNATIQQRNGELAYANNTPNGEITYNELTTPRGGQFVLVLPDGSRVWLNAASSIRFPTSFTKDRTVHVTGEAYFDIKPDASKPFIVQTTRSVVQVLGTAFNIMDYADEQQQTTLVNGAVKVLVGGEAVLLQPGTMARLQSGKLTVTNADVTMNTAWRNGQLYFAGQDAYAVLRQISRWYDVDIKLKGRLPETRLGGLMDKNVPLSAILEFLQENGITAKLDGSTIIVTGD
ncbi:MAG: FecR domain-containing protein [Chitinophaga sp.]|uniref:FecR family protein n=1 Tax=Chitinophaga sp. TaxID=1869181 RepID=UPI0025C6014D|nr:FecR domain-containing protein [Chitinophaga sp.]MBV8251588.1 FecR domain-containing protein [Chitinophaga sp.]